MKACMRMMIITLSVFIFVKVIPASERHHEAVVITQAPIIAANTTLPAKMRGIASAIASSQLHFDLGTNDLQAGVGVGVFKSTTAFSFGLAQRYSDTLISGSVSSEEGTYSFGAGVSFHF